MLIVVIPRRCAAGWMAMLKPGVQVGRTTRMFWRAISQCWRISPRDLVMTTMSWWSPTALRSVWWQRMPPVLMQTSPLLATYKIAASWFWSRVAKDWGGGGSGAGRLRRWTSGSCFGVVLGPHRFYVGAFWFRGVGGPTPSVRGGLALLG